MLLFLCWSVSLYWTGGGLGWLGRWEVISWVKLNKLALDQISKPSKSVETQTCIMMLFLIRAMIMKQLKQQKIALFFWSGAVAEAKCSYWTKGVILVLRLFWETKSCLLIKHCTHWSWVKMAGVGWLVKAILWNHVFWDLNLSLCRHNAIFICSAILLHKLKVAAPYGNCI